MFQLHKRHDTQDLELFIAISFLPEIADFSPWPVTSTWNFINVTRASSNTAVCHVVSLIDFFIVPVTAPVVLPQLVVKRNLSWSVFGST